MSHHFVDLLDELKSHVARMCSMVQQVVEQSVESLYACDARRAEKVIEQDQRIDEEEVRIEKEALALLALQQPAASDLRLIATIIKVNSELERVADCAVNVAQRALPLSRQADYAIPMDLRLMANSVISTLRDTTRAFNLLDVDLARQVLRSDDVIDALYHQIVQDMLATMQRDSDQVGVELANIMIAKNLERIGDHCTNICEQVIYVRSGQIVRHLRTA